MSYKRHETYSSFVYNSSKFQCLLIFKLTEKGKALTPRSYTLETNQY